MTECPLINTAMTVMHSYTGNVRAKQIVKPTFTLSTGVRLALVTLDKSEGVVKTEISWAVREHRFFAREG